MSVASALPYPLAAAVIESGTYEKALGDFALFGIPPAGWDRVAFDSKSGLDVADLLIRPSVTTLRDHSFYGSISAA